MKANRLYLFGAALLVIFAGFTLVSFRQSLTPYVSYEQARGADHTVQVAGGLVANSSNYDSEGHNLHFEIVDEETGDTMPVRYAGLKPANFEDAVSIVAIGSFDDAAEQFKADKLLVKCPSKYQGLEEKEYGGEGQDYGTGDYETQEYGSESST